MKKNTSGKLSFILALLVGITLCSCKKADDNLSAANHKGYKTLISTKGITLVSGVLIFADAPTFGTTISNLQAQRLADMTAFSKGKDSLPPDSVNAIALATGYNEDQTFVDFENHFSFHSMRLDWNNMESSWAANGLNDDDAGNPSNYFPFFSPFVLTTLNSNGQVGIGTDLYKVMRNGVVYVIANSDFSTLNKITDANMTTEFVASNSKTLHKELLGTAPGMHKMSKGICTDNSGAYVNYNTSSGKHAQSFIEVHDIGVYSWYSGSMINWQCCYSRAYGYMQTGHQQTTPNCVDGTPVTEQNGWIWAKNSNRQDGQAFYQNCNTCGSIYRAYTGDYSANNYIYVSSNNVLHMTNGI